MDDTHVTFDPRQQKIHEQLVRLGPGPAAFFSDACLIAQGGLPLQSASHLLGHCRRELKAALKHVLLPRDADAKTDADVIAAIAASFGFSPDHDVVTIWSELRLDRLAHRGALDSPRSLDEVRDAWETFQVLLSTLLDVLDGAYTRVYDDSTISSRSEQEGSCRASEQDSKQSEHPRLLLRQGRRS
jgi:hypothetical protein